MNDKFSIIPVSNLLQILLDQYDSKATIFGISTKQIFRSSKSDPFRSSLYGKLLESPIGVAAGPHSQLTQNIVAAWLTGARFIELKTIQTLDELEIAKPCIDMQDEGYNCEWSQELKVKESFEQYLNAWIIIHVLRHKLFGKSSGDPGTIFNMSVGYDLKGIMKDNVQWYLDKMENASEEIAKKREELRTIYPEIDQIEIGNRISDNITLSTMHGCPPDEIEKIGEYLISKRKLHTSIKLNPTLLGEKHLREILDRSGFETYVPAIAFEHDLKYNAALKIISSLRKKAKIAGIQFALKLTNTLESKNHKQVFESEEMMYMSGRPLHPIAVNLAKKLQMDHNGELNLSFSGGANADNICDLYQCGLSPVTVCTDLLKPGGYGRLNQYILKLKECPEAGNKEVQFNFLTQYAQKVLSDQYYKKMMISAPDLKTDRELGPFDCIHAPCVDTCPTVQNIPSYLHFAAEGDFENAYKVIRETNPFPMTTGMICDHLCQTKCVRIHYDSPVLIREVKRFLAEYAQDQGAEGENPNKLVQKKVAIIGGGPSGLSCAFYLAKAGMQVDVYEASDSSGGMISHAIPAFRLKDEAIAIDIDTILKMGVNIHFGHRINRKEFNLLRKKSDYIYIGAGAQKSAKLRLKGRELEGVLDPLDFLFEVKEGKRPDIGKNILIVGGGNTAMDAARTAWRLVGEGGKVTVIYRRNKKQMPADEGEIRAVIKEGVEIMELCNPVEIIEREGRISKLRIQRMKLGALDLSGRPKPIALDGEYFELAVDTLIPAIGQEKAFDFGFDINLKADAGSYETQIPGVFIGGDALRGASTAINAIGDGRKAANEIIEKAGLDIEELLLMGRPRADFEELMIKKSFRQKAESVYEPDISERKHFNVLSKSLDEDQVKKEASRCLKCDEVCSLCTTVCPNLAFHTYQITPVEYKIDILGADGDSNSIKERKVFSIQQEHQILHIADWCNLCGNCTTFCPTKGAPYMEKPHLYFDENTFYREKDGFHYKEDGGRQVLRGFREGRLFNLERKDDAYIFSSGNSKLKLSKTDLCILEIYSQDKEPILDTGMAVFMHIVMHGVNDFLNVKAYK